jgi:hypothetical protein
LGWSVVLCAVLSACTPKATREWQEAVAANTLERYRSFVVANPTNEHASEAKTRIEELTFQDTKKADSIQAYQAYLEQYPDGKHSGEAATLLEERFFHGSKSANTLKSYEEYLGKYPDGRFAAEARETAERLRPIRGEIEVTLVPMDYTFARMDVIWSLKSDKLYELELTPQTTFVGVANFEKPLNIHLPSGIYEIIGNKKSGSRLHAAVGTITATSVTLVAPPSAKRGAKLGM